jgi:hypothetical protein
MRIRIRDPVPWIQDSGWVKSKNQDPDPGSGIRNEQPGLYFLELINHFLGLNKIIKFFDAGPGSGLAKIRNRDPGWKKVESGIRINIPDLQHCYFLNFIALLIRTYWPYPSLTEGCSYSLPKTLT